MATKRETLAWGMPRVEREPPSSRSGSRRRKTIADKRLPPAEPPPDPALGQTLRPSAPEGSPPPAHTEAPKPPPTALATAETQEMPAVEPPPPRRAPTPPPSDPRREADAGVYRFVTPPSERRRKR